MGGQNHQPTNRTLICPSAWLSQKLGEGLIAVLNANNELENAIIVAGDRHLVEDRTRHLKGTPSEYLDKTISELELSVSKIFELQHAYKSLVRAACAEGYKGNPLSATIGDLNLAVQFSGTLILPSVNRDAWNAVESRVRATNILPTLEWESCEFDRLRELTIELKSVLQVAKAILVDDGPRSFVDAVESNQIPLRQCYARVFSLWNYLHAMFLYSALMMTELFYRSNHLPSLLDEASSLARVTRSVA
jgi:hypothetical protein